MPASKRKTGKASGPSNRYHRGSKLSEYKFLKLLRGFCDQTTPKELSTTLRVSEKTIRARYMDLRKRLMLATRIEPFAFGGAGFFLFQGNELSERGRTFLKEISTSEQFLRHIKRQAPRLAGSPDHNLYLFEATVRFFCNMQMGKTEDTLYPEETREHLHRLREIAELVQEIEETPEIQGRFNATLEHYERVEKQFSKLIDREELLSLAKKSKIHRYPSAVFHDDLRRHIVRHPL